MRVQNIVFMIILVVLFSYSTYATVTQSDDAYTGTYSVQIIPNTGDTGIYREDIALPIGLNALSLWYKTADQNNLSVVIAVYEKSGCTINTNICSNSILRAIYHSQQYSSTSSWKNVVIPFENIYNLVSTGNGYHIYLRIGASSRVLGNVFVDDIEFLVGSTTSTQDLGKFQESNQFVCNYANPLGEIYSQVNDEMNWIWEDAEQSTYQVKELANSVEIISNGNSWYICDATGTNVLSVGETYRLNEYESFPMQAGIFNAQGLVNCGGNEYVENFNDCTYDNIGISNCPDACELIDGSFLYGSWIDSNANLCHDYCDGTATITSPFQTTQTSTGDISLLKDQCADLSGNSICLPVTTSLEICNNGIDDDGNGFIDCMDYADCGSNPICSYTSTNLCGTEGSINCNANYFCRSYDECLVNDRNVIEYTISEVNNSFICYDNNDINMFAQCCEGSSCIDSTYQGQSTVGQNYFLKGNSLYKIKNFDGFQSGRLTDKVQQYYKQLSTGLLNNPPSPSVNSRILFSQGFSGIQKNHLDDLSPFSQIYFDMATNQVESIGRLKLYSSVDCGSGLLASFNLTNYATTVLSNNKWTRFIVDISSVTGPIGCFQIDAKSEQEVYLDSNILLTSDTYFIIDDVYGIMPGKTDMFCTGEYGFWITDYDPLLSEAPDYNGDGVDVVHFNSPDLIPYRFTCDANPSFGWTGTLCCGDDQTSFSNEFYTDVSAGCFSGNIIPHDKVVSDTVNDVTYYQNVLFFNETFHRCGRSIPLDLQANDVLTYQVNSDSTTERSICQVVGSYVCEADTETWQRTDNGNGFINDYTGHEFLPTEFSLVQSIDSSSSACCADGACWDGIQCVGNYTAHEDPNNVDQIRVCANGQWSLLADKKPDWNAYYPDSIPIQRGNSIVYDYEGYCFDQTDCYVGDVYTGPEKDPLGCVSAGFYFENYYCEQLPGVDGQFGTQDDNSNWTSRSKLLASELLHIARTQLTGVVNYSLSCAIADKVLQETGYENIDAFTDVMARTTVDNYCVLHYIQTNGNIITMIASSLLEGQNLNKTVDSVLSIFQDPQTSPQYTEIFVRPGYSEYEYCTNIDMTLNMFQTCGSDNEFYYNPVIHAFIYTDGTSLNPTDDPFWTKFVRFLKHPLDELRLWFARGDDKTNSIDQAYEFGLEVSDFDSLYVSHSVSNGLHKELIGTYEKVRNDHFLALRFENLTVNVNEFCSSLHTSRSSLNELDLSQNLVCTSSDNVIYVEMQTNQQPSLNVFNNYWDDLSSNLRLQ